MCLQISSNKACLKSPILICPIMTWCSFQKAYSRACRTSLFWIWGTTPLLQSGMIRSGTRHLKSGLTRQRAESLVQCDPREAQFDLWFASQTRRKPLALWLQYWRHADLAGEASVCGGQIKPNLFWPGRTKKYPTFSPGTITALVLEQRRRGNEPCTGAILCVPGDGSCPHWGHLPSGPLP